MHSGLHSRHGFTIGVLARQAGVPIDTIRHYEREGLLPCPDRRASGYREYSAASVDRIRFIRRAKDLGFGLDEIRELLVLSADAERGVEGIKRHASERLFELSQQIDTLVARRERLARLIDACPGSGALECCPILSSIQTGTEVPLPAAAPEPSASGASCCSSFTRTRTTAPAH